MESKSIIIVGAGIFGVSAALELAQRGHAVKLFDPGPLPHPDASSTDISKVLRMDYGADEFYFELMEAAFTGWDNWNQQWERPLYHQTGFLMLTREQWEPGGFEYDSFQINQKRGHQVIRYNTETLPAAYPAWNANLYKESYFNPRAGWAESGEVVRMLIHACKSAGVQLFEGKTFEHVLSSGSKATGIRTRDNENHTADVVLIAAGAWTPRLLPHLEDVMWTVGQPVIHFKPENFHQYQPPHFPVWNADIANTGWYGFPAKDDGILKIANHGLGYRVDPNGAHEVPHEEETRFREFLAESVPSLASAPKIADRLCLYCDTWDGDFWMDFDPEREGLFVCTGGSGHGFKFAPMLGKISADVIEGKANDFAHRFQWRKPGIRKTEDARFLK